MWGSSGRLPPAAAEKKGWAYEVAEPNHVSPFLRPKRYQGYGDNFSTKRKASTV